MKELFDLNDLTGSELSQEMDNIIGKRLIAIQEQKSFEITSTGFCCECNTRTTAYHTYRADGSVTTSCAECGIIYNQEEALSKQRLKKLRCGI